MRLSRIFLMAWNDMKQRKLRTSLTTLGVVIGVTAIVGLASLSEGFRLEIGQRLQTGFELDNLTVVPGSLLAGLSRDRFTDDNINQISGIQGVRVATGIMQIGSVALYNGGKPPVQAFAAAAVNFTEFVKVFPDRFVFESGGLPTEHVNNTIVIGHKVNNSVENESFAAPNDNITLTLGILKQRLPPFQPYIESQNYTFTVAGILEQKGSSGITDFDYWIFLPLDTARKIFNTEESDLVFVRISDPEKAERISRDIESMFPPFKITILAALTFIKRVDNILAIVQIFLTAVASISLFVAGIGTMNVMTVSVIERTHEIGVLKAIGAKNRMVLALFLSEGLLIGLVGGIIGIFAGYGLSLVLASVLTGLVQSQQNPTFLAQEASKITITPAFSPEWTIVAFVLAVVMCVIFGLYPARKAARLNVVEALRYE